MPSAALAASVASPLDRRVPLAAVAAHARPGVTVGVWLAGGVGPPSDLLIGSSRGPHRAALVVSGDLGALIRRVHAVLVLIDGAPRVVASGALAAARLLEVQDMDAFRGVGLGEASAEEVLADVLARGRSVAGSRISYRFDSPPDGPLG